VGEILVALSIILVNWNTKDYVLDCIQSIIDNPPRRSYDIWLVDNGSIDGTADAVREHFPDVKLIVNETKISYALANNDAGHKSAGAHLLFLNVDTVVHAGALEAMCAYLDAHAGCGMVSCKLLNRDGSVQRSAWRGYPGVKSAFVDAFYLWKLFPRVVAANEVVYSNPDKPIEVDHLLGASMMVTREIANTVGLMSPEYPFYLVETDWCWRIKRAGHAIVYEPGTTITHFGQGTQRNAPVESLTSWNASLVQFVRADNGGRGGLRIAALKLFLSIGMLVRVGLWTWRGIREPAHSRGMRAGYAQVLRELSRY
jgi:GT2 family glycosyltransferase